MSNRKERRPLPYSPNTYNSMRDQGSPTKASVLLQQDHAEYIESLQGRKQNFCTCLELYRVSYENEIPQKCLVHNNFITLYCENEFKLLCVNCIYGSAVHKDHRVIPSKNSIANIARDNQDNMRVLEEELERIKHVDVEMKKNKRVLDDEYKIILKQIDDEFRDIYQMIERKHNETRQRAIDAFSRATGVNDTGVHEVSWWKELLIKTRGTLPKPSQNQQTEIYKHLVLDLFMQQKIDEEKLTYLPSGQQIRSQFLREINELKEAVQRYAATSNSYRQEKPKTRMF